MADCLPALFLLIVVGDTGESVVPFVLVMISGNKPRLRMYLMLSLFIVSLVVCSWLPTNR